MVESLVMPRQDTADQEKEDEVLAEVPVVAPDTLANTGVGVTRRWSSCSEYCFSCSACTW